MVRDMPVEVIKLVCVVPNIVMLLYLMYEDKKQISYTVLLRHYVNTEHYVNGNWLESQGQGYITTNSQSVSMSWYRAQSQTIDQSLLSPWNLI
jgi:hypothetical protein